MNRDQSNRDQSNRDQSNRESANHIQITARFGALDLQVEASFANQFIIISGDNGAGKTSLLRCLAGLESASGMLQMGDKIWLDSSAGFSLPAQQRQLGCVWPDAALLPWLSVEKNIVFGADSVNSQWLATLATQFEITALMERKPCMLSTGEMQRVSLARSLYRKPAVLLLDEPFSAQAPAIRQRLRLCLKALQSELAMPVLMVSHDSEDARILAQQHWHLRAGKLLLSLADTQESNMKNKAKVQHHAHDGVV